jgi:broad specificity polyphosphatase/5'/3'-nucleotidase SurE
MILVSNDDGIHSEGLRASSDAMKPLDDIVVAARGLTNHACRLRLERMELRWP